MNLKIIYYIGLSFLTLSSCEIITNTPIDQQAVYFEYEYINYAWGFQHNGWIIDEEGNVRSFKLPEDWQYPDSSGMISEAALLYNIKQTDSIIAVVDSTELDKYTALITGARDGRISVRENTAADAGSASLHAYLYDEEKDAYLKIFLASSGDWSSENESYNARKLVKWLKEFGVFWL